MIIPLLQVTAEFFRFNSGIFRRAGEFISGTAESDLPSSVRSAQHIISDRLGHAAEDQPHPHRGDEADDARRRVDAARADAAEDRVGIGEEREVAPIVASIAATIAISEGTSAKRSRTSEPMPSTVAFAPRACRQKPPRLKSCRK